MKKKICIIGPFPPIKGGIPQYNDFLARELQKESDVYLFSYKRQYPSFLRKNREQIDSNYKGAGKLNNIDFAIDSINPLTWFTTLKKIQKISPDLVILPWWVIYWAPMYFIFLSVFRALNIKTLLLCHNIYEHEDHYLKRVVTMMVFKLADYYLVHSSSEKNKLLPLIGEKKFIQHLHPLYKFSAKNIDESGLTEEEGRINLLFFGFVRKYKGLDILLEAMHLLNNDKIHLKIVGEFWAKKEEYLNYIEHNHIKNIEIIDGYIADDDIEKFFLETDVVVLPYRSATGSGVIATSYGYGKPVLVTNVGGLVDAVVHKKTGYIVEADPTSIAAGVEWFKQYVNEDFSTNISKFTVKHMSWRGLCHQILKLT